MIHHPLADLFPMLSDDELSELAADIKKNGLTDEIVVLDGQILDGRNRYRACQIAGVEPRLSEFSGDDPTAFVVSKNLHRRHLTPSQRALVAARLATMPLGGVRTGQNTKASQSLNLSSEPVSQAQAAGMLNVSRSQVQSAKRLIAHGDQTAISAVESGEMTLNAALTADQLAMCNKIGVLMALGEEHRASKPRRPKMRTIVDAEIVEETHAGTPVDIAIRQLGAWCSQDPDRRITIEIEDAGTVRRLTITEAGIEESA